MVRWSAPGGYDHGVIEPSPVPIQVLFATSTSRGVVVDGLVLADGPAEDDRPGAGEPFSILMERNPASDEDQRALDMLRRWSDGGSVVEVTTTHGGRWLVLRSGGDELVLVIS